MTALSPVRILLVDDEVLLAMTLRLELRRAGYQPVGVASSGPEAVALAARLKPDVVLMDVGLPGEFDGIEAARRIRAEAGGPAPGPVVIFISGFRQPEMQARMQAIPRSRCLEKPINIRELTMMLEALLPPSGRRPGEEDA